MISCCNNLVVPGGRFLYYEFAIFFNDDHSPHLIVRSTFNRRIELSFSYFSHNGMESGAVRLVTVCHLITRVELYPIKYNGYTKLSQPCCLVHWFGAGAAIGR